MDPNGSNESIDDDQTDYWFGGNYFSDEEDDSLSHVTDNTWSSSTNGDNLCDVMKRLGQQEGAKDVQDYKERARVVDIHMGSMALCRGERGEMLREAGAINFLLTTLVAIKSSFPAPTEPQHDSIDEAILALAAACFGAIRDLACGSAENRSAVRTFSLADTRGLELLAQYLKLYDKVQWEAIPSHEHLCVLTNTIGAMRNLTHSTGDNCVELYKYGVASMMAWRLLHSGTSLPDATAPWREAAFRAGGTLINMAEKCNYAAVMCARDETLICILIESWGGTAQKTAQVPMLHLGLAAILIAAKVELSNDQYDPSWNVILAKEQERKQVARRKEEKRKRFLLINK
jgi:hypothetical protein